MGPRLTATVMKNALSRYPQGADVAVYYDPQRPSRSCLEPGASFRSALVASVFGFGLTTFGIVILYDLAVAYRWL